MAKSPNMKVNVTADNTELKRQMQDSKAAVKDFEKVGSNAIGKLGEAFGVNSSKVQQMTSAVRGLGEKLQSSANAGTAAFGKLLTSVSGVSAGIAGIGIAGVVAGFKALKDEAEAFKNTVQGANIELQTQAYISTYKQFVSDLNQGIGEGAANAESSWKKFWGTLGSDIKLLLTTPGSFGTTEGLDMVVKAQAEAQKVAQSASDITKEIYDTQRQISDKSVEWARSEREIAEYKRIAYDKTADTVTQQEALNKAVALIKQRYQEEADLRQRLADLQVEYNDLVSSSPEDIDKANQLLIVAENTVARMNNSLRELSEKQATITANAEKEALAREQAAAAAAAVAQSRAELAAWNGSVSAGNTLEASMPAGATALNVPGIAVPVEPELDEESTIDLTNQLQMLISAGLDSLGSSIGGLISDLATGEDAWGNFTNAAISAFGDMAIAVGKMAIATGAATLGIKAALESLNGFVAIAAGVALVALGTAVKSGLGNIAGGSYTASSNVAYAGSSYSSPTSVNTAFDQQELNIKVTGTLRADGNQLMTVIENEQRRKNHTT